MRSAFVPNGLGGGAACGPTCAALATLLFAVACGDDSAPPVGTDGGAIDARPICATNEDCDDGEFCNGVETCDPANPASSAHGCVPGVSTCVPVMQTCVEADDACVTNCAMSEDADGDGVEAVECGGLDCNDGDPRTYPGRLEVCDPSGHDEDCDPTTIGARDLDADGYTSSVCANTAADGTVTRGDDCDDNRSISSPSETELCDGIDNDCDEMIDDGVGVPGFVDADGDRDGNPAMPRTGCLGSVHFSESGTDCNDDAPDQNGFQVEACDLEDNDCDGNIDESPAAVPWYRDADGDGFGRSGSPVPGDVVVSCAAPMAEGSYSLLSTDCDDALARINPAAAEQCDGLDNDCNGLLDGETGVRPGDLEDDDGDGITDAACILGSNDCDDTDPFSGLADGLAELCGDGRDNDCDMRIDEASDAVAWYPDADADGYASGAGAALMSCELQLGYSYRLGDCDDSSPDRHPSAHDVCDRVDQDCDGRADEDAPARAFFFDADGDGVGTESGVLYACGDPPLGYGRLPRDCAPDDDMTTTEFVDADRDSFGDSTMPLTVCTGSTRGVTAAGDCNDRDADVNPSIAELCNGLDDDCDRSVDETGGMGCPAGATFTCEAGACRFMGCLPGHEDCDALPANGCEDTMTSVTHCGGCGGDICGAGGACVAGSCTTDVVEVRVSTNGSCARRANQNIVCWGSSVDGLAALEPRSVYVAGASSFVMGNVGVCANIGGTFQCKIEFFGSLGYHYGLGFEAPRAAIPLTPMRATGLTDVAIGDTHGCGIAGPDRNVVCWGANALGQLGDGTTTLRPEPVGVLTLSDAVDIAVGYRFSCAALATGEVRCWGENTYRQLGDGTTLHSDRPVTVALSGTATDPVEEVVAGVDYACGRRRSGAVDCWGSAFALGAGGGAITAPARVITASGDLAGAVELTASLLGQRACARTASGEAWCWGAVGEEHGDGTITGGLRAVRVLTAPGVPLADVVSIATAQFHTCAVVSDGGVYCWGQGVYVLGLRRSDAVLYATRLPSLP